MCKTDDPAMDTPVSLWESDEAVKPVATSWQPVPSMWEPAADGVLWGATWESANGGQWAQAEDWKPSYVVNDGNDGAWKPSDGTASYVVNESSKGSWRPCTEAGAEALWQPAEATFLQPSAVNGELPWAPRVWVRCADCPLEFHTHSELQHHRATAHYVEDVFAPAEGLEHAGSPRAEQPNEEQGDDVDSNVDSTEAPVVDKAARKVLMTATTCPECGKVFTNPFSMRRHFEIHGKGSFEEVHHLQRRRANEKHRDPVYPCTECPKRFTTPFSMRRHLAVHGVEPSETPPTPGATYSCGYCPKVFRHADSYNSHLQFHLAPMSFQCGLCPVSYATASELNRHTVRTHNQRYPCTLCPRKFGFQNELRRHMYTHSALSFSCALCVATFASFHYLNKHYRRTHRVLLPYQCVDCGEAFNTMTKMELHQKTCPETAVGQRYTCPTCRARFADTKNLENHLVGHAKKAESLPGAGPAANAEVQGQDLAEEEQDLAEEEQDLAEQGPVARQDSAEQVEKAPVKDRLFCTECDESFGSEGSLARHSRARHDAEPDRDNTFSCSVCLQRFALHRDLLLHLNRHLGRSFGVTQ